MRARLWPCFRSTGMLSLFSFFFCLSDAKHAEVTPPFWVCLWTLAPPCVCECYVCGCFLCTARHTNLLNISVQKSKLCTRERNQWLELEERAVLWRHVQVWQTPFFFFFWRGSFFLSFPSVRVGQTPITCPIDLKQKRPHTAGRARGQADVKTFFHPRGFFCLGSIPSPFRGHKESAALSRVIWDRAAAEARGRL